MKSVKLAKKDSKVSRKLITQFGEVIYNYPEVEAVRIQVDFKDGSSISFKRDECEDKLENLFEEDKD